MKKIALILGLVVSAFVVVGCASKTQTTDTTAAQTQVEPAKKAKDLKGESI